MTSDEATGRAPAGIDAHPTSPPSAQRRIADGSAERRLALLVDAVEEYAILMLEPDGTVATWNAGAERIKGYTAEEIVGQHFSVFYEADDVLAGKPARELAHALEHGECRDQGRRVRKDGSVFWANVVITAVFEDDGRLEGFAKVTRDETERKETDERLRQLELLTDRERIGGDLGQSIVHGIYEAGLHLQSARELIRDPVAAARVDQAVELLDDTVRQIRTVVFNLSTGGD